MTALNVSTLLKAARLFLDVLEDEQKNKHQKGAIDRVVEKHKAKKEAVKLQETQEIEAEEVSQEDILKLLRRIQTATSRDQALTILDQFGATRLQDVKVSDYQKLYNTAKKFLAELDSK